jgi:medium-chain acyl-[acyl-carrier-protein] hydrolase
MNAEKLFLKPQPNASASMQLFCFPFAGGNASTYRPWIKYLHRDIELITVQLPGRGSLLAQKPFDNMSDLVAELAVHIKNIIEKPYVFFGHSLGSKIAFELACALQRQHCPLPVHFFASGAGAPFKPRMASAIHQLPDAEFIRRIGALCGTPEKILQNDELMRFMLPALRADFKLIETYIGDGAHELPIPLTILGGEFDEAIARDDLLAWQKVFGCVKDIKIFPGGHFFINQHAADIVALINALLTEYKNRLSENRASKNQWPDLLAAS